MIKKKKSKEKREKERDMSATFSGDETAPFFGFIGASTALVFSCKPCANSDFVNSVYGCKANY